MQRADGGVAQVEAAGLDLQVVHDDPALDGRGVQPERDAARVGHPGVPHLQVTADPGRAQVDRGGVRLRAAQLGAVQQHRLADLQPGRGQRRPRTAGHLGLLEGELAADPAAGHPQPADRLDPVQVDRAGDVEVVRGQRPAVRVDQAGPAQRDRPGPGADQPDRAVRPVPARLDALAQVDQVGDVQVGGRDRGTGRVGGLDPAGGQPAADVRADQLDGARGRAAGGHHVVEHQVAAHGDPVGDHRHAALPVQPGGGQVELAADPRADQADRPEPGELLPEQRGALHHRVVGQQAGDRAAAEVEQRQRGPAQQHPLGEAAAAHPQPDRGAHAVQVERAEHHGAAQPQPARVRPVADPAEQHVPDHLGADLPLRPAGDVEQLAAGHRGDQRLLQRGQLGHGRRPYRLGP